MHRNTFWSTRMLSGYNTTIVALSRDTTPVSTLDRCSRWESSTEVREHKGRTIPRWHSRLYQFLTPSKSLDMVYYWKPLSRSTLYLCYFLQACPLHHEKTRHSRIFLRITVTRCRYRCHGNHDSLSWPSYTRYFNWNNCISQSLSYPLYACDEIKYNSMKNMNHSSNLPLAPLDIWRRFVGALTRSIGHHTFLHTRLYHKASRTALCPSLISCKYL